MANNTETKTIVDTQAGRLVVSVYDTVGDIEDIVMSNTMSQGTRLQFALAAKNLDKTKITDQIPSAFTAESI